MIKIISGYFDPLHVGHIEYITNAYLYGDYSSNDKVIVILNNDKQCILKKGKSFMNENERKQILENLKYVDKVFISIDEDRSVIKTLQIISEFYSDESLVFLNGGDVIKNCREEQICKQLHIDCVYGMGKKIQSSSNLTGIKEIK